MLKYYCLMTIIDFGEWLQKTLIELDWSQSDLARQSGLSTGQISRLISGSRKPGRDTCIQIAKGLKLPPENIFRAAGLLPSQPPTDDIIEQILYELGGVPITDKEDILEYIRLRKQIAEKRGNYGN